MKNSRYILYTLVLVVGIFTFSGCDSVDFGNINADDDVVTEANTEGLMAGAMNRYFSIQHVVPTLYVQYQSQAVYTTAQTYGVSPSPWQAYYVRTLSNLNQVYEITTADEVGTETLAYGAPKNQAAVAELMSALIWKRVTDTWGPVPYKESLGKADTITPAYTDQETIYKDLISRVKAARDMLDTSMQGPTGDVIYGGDVSKWKKFANSFLMTLSMQLTKKYPSNSGFAATEFTSALNHSAGVVENLSEEAWYMHANQTGMENPFSALRGADYFFSEPFDRALSGESDGSVIDYSSDMYDDRLNVFSSDTSLPGRPYGYSKLTGDEATASYASLSTDIIAPDAPLPYMTAAKTYLLRAEAAQRGWTSESASSMFINGVEMSYATIEQHWDDGDSSTGDLQSDGSSYAAQRWADAINNGNEMQVIGEEQWVALFPMGFQAWANWRRTDYPTLHPAPDATNTPPIIPRRYLYPGDESGVNTQNYNNAVQMLSPAEDNNTSRFWWDIE